MAQFQALTDSFQKSNHYERLISMLSTRNYFKIAFSFYEVLSNMPRSLPISNTTRPKCSTTSDLHRTMGNMAFTSEQYDSALQLYNLALLHAPLNSESYIYAISNRSALFCKIKKFSAALNDIQTCLSLNCPMKLKIKLNKRKEECESLIWEEDVVHNNELGNFDDAKESEKFFTVSGEQNPKYPFATNSIDVVMKDGKEKVVAKSYIKIGEIVAIEKAHISINNDSNKLLFCYYCSKYEDNLIPCPTCTHVLYCNEACKKQCWQEYHNIECSMSQIIDLLPIWYKIWLKFVLKTWNTCKDLKKFSAISNKTAKLLLGQEGPPKLELGNLGSYLIAPPKDRITQYGSLYNAAMQTSLVIHGLRKVPDFVLETSNKKELIANIAQQIMYHVMHTPCFLISGASLMIGKSDVVVNNVEAMGFFPLLSRFQHSCHPNILAVGLGNRMALVCLSPVKPGSELTIAYGGEFYDNTKQERQYGCYSLYGFLCGCRACNEDWKAEEITIHSEECRAVLETLKWCKDIKTKFRNLCEGLTKHSHAPTCKDYQIIHTLFRCLLGTYQYCVTRQRFIGKSEEYEK